MFYAIEWGGAASDRAYKDAGSLEITGPFDTEADARQFLAGLREWDPAGSFTPTEGSIIEGEINARYVDSPQDRLRVEWQEWDLILEDGPDRPREELSEEEVAVLDRWWPNWVEAVESAYATVEVGPVEDDRPAS